ncbi:MAG: M14 family metallopeptidase [Gemmatimonadota bacterium]|nr:M14 family metallopeptidase [Gemmatimonadota bacterium]
MIRPLALATALALSPLLPGSADAQATIPSPRAVLGFEVGADRQLADWGQIVDYLGKLAAASPAVKLDTLGLTTERRPFVYLTVSSAENMRRLDAIRSAQALLADPRRLPAEEEARLIASQPAVVLISCNIHSSEIASSQMAMELAWRLATNDTLQSQLKNVVVLLIPSMNPDGEQMITDWYRRGLGTKWEGGPMPWIYHHYVGHDNNRDWFMVTQQETKLVTDLLYRRWFPSVFYDVHQMGNEGSRLFVPPFVDPVNPNVDPLIVRGIGQIGGEMAWALQERGKSGVADHAIYDLWWHGGARSTPTRHNMIGLLTEAASVKIATPITQSATDLKGHARGLPHYQQTVNFPDPWPGGVWRLRDIVEYEEIASEALIRLADRQRADYVRVFAHLGRTQLRLGQSVAPYAFVIPAGQRDRTAADKLVDVLRVGGVEVGMATAAFEVAGQSVAAGSYVVSMAQPYRAHAKDLLEIQRYPRVEKYPGGPIERPYDVSGWTLPLQMGVRVIEAPQPLAVATRPVTGMPAPSPALCVAAGPRRTALDPRDSRSYALIGAALRGGNRVGLAASSTSPGGVLVMEGAAPPGCGPASATSARATSPTQAVRIALYKPWTGNIDEGWTRFVLEQFGFPFTSVTDSVVKAGRLRDHFDVLIVSDMGLREIRSGMSESAVPPGYAGGLGGAGIENVRTFVSEGGTLVLLDHASQLATEALGVPVKLITSAREDDQERSAGTAADSARGRRAQDGLYAPGSILRVLVNAGHPVAYGMPDTAAVYFTNSVTYDVGADSGVKVIARYPGRAEDILLSGYLQGAQAIAGKAAAVEAPLGRGRVVMFGFRPQHRGQSYGTFRMMFNALLGGATVER